MKSITVTLYCLIVGTLCLASLAVAEGAPRPRASILEGVPTLDTRVTYSETKIPLGELVQKVAADTGADLMAAPEVADEPVAVVVKAMPARQLLEQVAALLDYQWSSQGHAGAWRCEIDQDLASKQREEALRQAQMDAVEKRLKARLASYRDLAALPADKFQAVLDAAQKQAEELQRLTPEARQARLNSPDERAQEQRFQDARRLWTPANRALARLIGGLMARQWTELRQEGWINFCTDPQPGEARLPLAAEKAFQVRQPGSLVSATAVSAGDPGMLAQMREGDERAREQWTAASGYRVTLRLETDRVESGGALWLTATAFPLQSGAPMPPSPTDGDGWRSVFLYAGPEDLPEQQAQAAEQTPERLARMARDPVVGVKNPFQPTVKPRRQPFGPGTLPLRFRDLLPDLARVYGVQFISDAYWTSSPRVAGPLPSGPVALFTLLDRLAGATHQWDHAGNLIWLRSRTWFFDRPREVPLRLVRHWKGVAVKWGLLPLEEDVAMATSLTDAQLDTLDQVIEQADLPPGSVNPLGVNIARHALRLFASLSPGQQQALWHGKAIPLAEMTPAQRARFMTGLNEAVRRWYQPIPIDTAHLAESRFVLSAQPMIRTIMDQGGSVYLAPVAGPGSAGGPRPEAFGTPVKAPPTRVEQVSFGFDDGAGQKKSYDLLVAPP